MSIFADAATASTVNALQRVREMYDLLRLYVSYRRPPSF